MNVGDRVQLHPGLDLWMMGCKYGEVVKLGRKYVHVKLDRTGRTVKIHPTRLEQV